MLWLKVRRERGRCIYPLEGGTSFLPFTGERPGVRVKRSALLFKYTGFPQALSPVGFVPCIGRPFRMRPNAPAAPLSPTLPGLLYVAKWSPLNFNPLVLKR